MEEYNEKRDESKDFLSYIDDDGQVKNQYVIIIKKDNIGIEFSFSKKENNFIFVPWHRILKLKIKGDKHET